MCSPQCATFSLANARKSPLINQLTTLFIHPTTCPHTLHSQPAFVATELHFVKWCSIYLLLGHMQHTPTVTRTVTVLPCLCPQLMLLMCTTCWCSIPSYTTLPDCVTYICQYLSISYSLQVYPLICSHSFTTTPITFCLMLRILHFGGSMEWKSNQMILLFVTE